MPVSDLNTLKNSKLVKRITHEQVDSAGGDYVLKVTAELVNGWILHCWEHSAPKVNRYSFHVIYQGKMVVRWDNAPHHPGVDSFPHHKHEGKTIEASRNMTLGLVLAELRRMIEDS